MRHPSYLLNPGDLFQVEPDRVMFATGTPKNKVERREGRLAQRKTEGEESEEAEATEAAAEVEAESKDAPKEDTKETLKALMQQAKSIMSTDKDTLPAKRKQELRGFQKAVRRVLSRSASSTVLTDSLEAQFSQLTLLLNAKRAEKKPEKKDEKKDDKRRSDDDGAVASNKAEKDAAVSDKLSEAFAQATQGNEVDSSELDDEEFETLKRALVQMRDNPIDNTKPYATPWRPRDYMSAFTFIPRYLEVNQNICAAVYLRHPVARPGVAEVPTPFGESVATPAYGWYLRRRW
jgi:ribosomal protein S4